MNSPPPTDNASSMTNAASSPWRTAIALAIFAGFAARPAAASATIPLTLHCFDGPADHRDYGLTSKVRNSRILTKSTRNR